MDVHTKWRGQYSIIRGIVNQGKIKKRAHQIVNFNKRNCHRSGLHNIFKKSTKFIERARFLYIQTSFFQVFITIISLFSQYLEYAIHIKHHLINYYFIKCIILSYLSNGNINNDKFYKWIWILVFTHSLHLFSSFFVFVDLMHFKSILCHFIGIASIAFNLNFHDFFVLHSFRFYLRFGFSFVYYNSRSF